MKDVGDGFYLNPHAFLDETRYQVIYSAASDGHRHIVACVAGGLKTEAAAMQWLDTFKQDPDWKEKLEYRIVSGLLRGYTTKYQLKNFDKLFEDWSGHETMLAFARLAERAEMAAKRTPEMSPKEILGEIPDNALAALKSAAFSDYYARATRPCGDYHEGMKFPELDRATKWLNSINDEVERRSAEKDAGEKRLPDLNDVIRDCESRLSPTGGKASRDDIAR